MPALTAKQLDVLTMQGCSTPGCTHSNHKDVYLHGACHPHSPAKMEYFNGTLLIACATCGQRICAIQVTGLEAAPVNHCHEEADLYGHWVLQSGELRVECGECHQLLEKVQVIGK